MSWAWPSRHVTRSRTLGRAESVKEVAAYFKVSEEDLRARLRADLSAYKVPRHLFFDRAQDLPFTDSGKIDKRQLAQRLAERIREGKSLPKS